MQVLTNIDEADVGRVKEGQKAIFTVDAFPDRMFDGVVSQIRLSPQIVQNVVTYPVVLDVSNPKTELKPGMTANVQIPVQREEGQLKIPNAALRFRPSDSDVEATSPQKADAKGQKGPESKSAGSEPATAEKKGPAEGKRGGGGGGQWAGRSGGGQTGPGRPSGKGGASREVMVYVEGPNGKLRKVAVKPLLTDGSFTAVTSETLKEGDEIVVGLATAKALNLGNSRQTGGGSPGRGARF
jgi:HlyD family secretion protein